MKSEDGTGSRHALVVLKEMWEGHPTCFIQAVGRRFRSPALFLFLFMIEYRLNTIIGVKDGRERGQNMDYGTILEKRDSLKALRSFIPEYTLLTFENAFEIEYTQLHCHRRKHADTDGDEGSSGGWYFYRRKTHAGDL